VRFGPGRRKRHETSDRSGHGDGFDRRKPLDQLTPEEVQQWFLEQHLLRQRPELDLLFRELDDRHFGGMLTAKGWLVGIHDLSKEADDCIMVKRPGAAGAWAYCRVRGDADGFTMPPPSRLILIDQDLDPGVARFAGWIRQTLLHEMAHAAVGETSKTLKPVRRQGPHRSHGRRFLAELKRLVAGGRTNPTGRSPLPLLPPRSKQTRIAIQRRHIGVHAPRSSVLRARSNSRGGKRIAVEPSAVGRFEDISIAELEGFLKQLA
jgi:hypothetical protein